MSAIKWRVSAHAVRRINERYGIDPKSAANWANQFMDRDTYVCVGADDNGKACRIYSVDKKVFHADTIDNVILTVFDAQIKRPVVTTIADTLIKELQKMEIAVLKREHAVIAERAPIESELAKLRLSLARAKSSNRRQEFSGRITELETYVRQLNAELTKSRRALTQFAEGFASIV